MIQNQKSNEQFSQFIIQPEPWFTDYQLTNPKKNPNIPNISRSFQVSISNNDLKNCKLNHGRSISSINAINVQNERKNDSTIKRLKCISEQKNITQTFNYTD